MKTRSWLRSSAVQLSAIMLLGAAIRLAVFQGMVGSDDLSYARVARDIGIGRFQPGDWQNAANALWSLRVGILLPAAALVHIFGPLEWCYLAYPFVLSVTTIPMAYLAARMFFGGRAAPVAALLSAILPIDTVFATRFYTDLAAAFWISVGMLTTYVAVTKSSARLRPAVGVLAGLAFGISWLHKETLPFAVPLIGLYLLWATWRNKAHVSLLFSIPLGFALVFGAEALYYHAGPGDWLLRVHGTIGAKSTLWDPNMPEWALMDSGPNRAVLKRILVTGPLTLMFNPSFGMIPLAAALATLYALCFRKRSFAFPGLWFVGLCLTFNFATVSLHSYTPLKIHGAHYLYVVLFPAVLLSAGFIDMLLIGPPDDEPVRERRFWGHILILLVGLTCLHTFASNLALRVGSRVERQAVKILGPSDGVYTDPRTSAVMEFFWKYPGSHNLRDYTHIGADDIPAGSYILVNPDRLLFMQEWYGAKPHAFLDTVPRDWLLRASIGEAKLYFKP